MNKVMIVSTMIATLTLPTASHAWVAAGNGHYGRVGYGHAHWHGGYHCGGVSTGTAVAAGFAGLAVGAAVGSAAARNSQPTYVVAPTPVVYAAPPPVVVPGSAPVGGIYHTLPAGAKAATINGAQYYVLGSTYFKPEFGNNGVYYEVVASPI